VSRTRGRFPRPGLRYGRVAVVATGLAVLAAGCGRPGWWIPGTTTTRPTVTTTSTTSTTTAGGSTSSTTSTTVPTGPGSTGAWLMSGRDAANSRWADTERAISPATAAGLKLKWSIDMSGDVSATPTVADGVVYVPDMGGSLTAADARTGAVLWRTRVPDYTGNPQSVSRNSPVVYGDLLIIGEIKKHTHAAGAAVAGDVSAAAAGDEHDDGGGDHHDAPPPGTEGAHLIGVKRATGEKVWITGVEAHPYAFITANPVLAGDKIVVGVSGNEENEAINGTYPCCSLRGSVVKVDARTGYLDWQTYVLPPNPTDKRCGVYNASTQEFAGCADSGAAVWNTPAVDIAGNAVYFGTGNNYTVTDEEYRCARDARAANRPDDDCVAADNHVESVLSLDLGTGRIKWAHKLGGFDAWNYNCVVNPGRTWCPSPYGEDYDFGANTNLFTATIAGAPRNLVGIGQKSGIYWALDRGTGEVVWNTLVGPGGALGGIEWGTAVDADRIYTANANFTGKSFTLPSGQTANKGSWQALDRSTGRILWQTPVPPGCTRVCWAMGPTSVANGVMFGGVTAPTGANMHALDAATGRVLWSYAAKGSVNSGPAIVDGTVFWGSGYSDMAAMGMTAGAKLYAFSP
jgi:polyvinyl alcohol dehydrogenase (cytochrome)